jgi:hypothetical protein
MLATKPVATFGTSRARAALKASALRAVVVARMRSRFRLFILASGMTHQRVVAMLKKLPLSARRIWKSGWPKTMPVSPISKLR